MSGIAVKDWDFGGTHVDSGAMTTGGTTAGNFISSESIVLAAGPASYDMALDSSLATLTTIGVCDTIQVQQQKGVIQLYEIGSRLPYLIPGRPITQFAISRVLFNGDSLMGALTAGNTHTTATTGSGEPGLDFTVKASASTDGGDTSGKFYLNLASQFFNTPFGLALYFKDSENQWVAAYYAENCIIQSHSMAIQGQNMVVMENASVRCTTFKPMTGPSKT